jgi:hypothetical protein
MEYSRDDKIRFGQQVVRETKKSARVDTGFLKRSIRATLNKGIVEFRLIDYGAYNGNSKIVEVAKDIMPNEIEWKIIFVDEDGRETPVEGKTRTGRTISRKSISSENVSTNKIKSLIAALQNGKKNNDNGEADSRSDKEKP